MTLCDWEGNRRSGVALAMRHRLGGLSTYRLNGHKKGDNHSVCIVRPLWGIALFTTLSSTKVELITILMFCRLCNRILQRTYTCGELSNYCSNYSFKLYFLCCSNVFLLLLCQVVAVCVLTEDKSMLLRVWDGTKISMYVFLPLFCGFCTYYIFDFHGFSADYLYLC